MGQPLDHILAHLGNNFVRRVITFERDGAGACSQLSFVIPYSLGRVKLVTSAGEMKHTDRRRLIQCACFPIARNAATDTNYAAQVLTVCESEAIIERARL